MVRQPLQQAYKCQELDAEQGANLDDIRDYVATRCRAEPLAGLLTAAGKRPESVAELLCEKSGCNLCAILPLRMTIFKFLNLNQVAATSSR